MIGRPARPSHNPTVRKRSDIKLRVEAIFIISHSFSLSSLLLFLFFFYSLSFSLSFSKIYTFYFSESFFYWDRETWRSDQELSRTWTLDCGVFSLSLSGLHFQTVPFHLFLPTNVDVSVRGVLCFITAVAWTC